MKNKKLIWILAPAVLVLWGIIIYRVVKVVQGNKDTVYTSPAPPAVIPAAKGDTASYALHLEYDDPFLKNSQKRAVKPKTTRKTAPKKKKPKVVKTVKKLPVKWPAITYNGIVDGNQRSLCLLRVNGASVFISKGEEIDDLKLLEVYKDSVKLEYKGDETKTIVKK